MIAVVKILDSKGNVMNKKIGLELGLGTEQECLAKIPPEYKFVCWNSESNEDLLVKVI